MANDRRRPSRNMEASRPTSCTLPAEGKRSIRPGRSHSQGQGRQVAERRVISDKDGHVRTEIRTRWYLSPNGQTYRTYALQSDEIACDLEIEQAVIAAAVPYPRPPSPCSSAITGSRQTGPKSWPTTEIAGSHFPQVNAGECVDGLREDIRPSEPNNVIPRPERPPDCHVRTKARDDTGRWAFLKFNLCPTGLFLSWTT